MKISYNWLKNYVDFNLTPKDLGEVLTGVGLEVEDVTPFETIQGGLEGVVIGEVKECAKHPDADKLSVTKVDVGTGELLQIVCGAPNVAAGQKVVVALVGSTLYPSGGEKLQIKKAKIRGVESFGMICAEDEIGLNDNHAGIMVLEPAAVVGTKAADYFKIESDFVLEIGLTPNRGDANSHIGVARDVAAALNVAYKAKVNFTKPDTSNFKVANTELTIAVDVLDAQACPRYSGVTISGITVAESPDWLKNKLKAIGVRSINNVVDITNYVLHEYGQPLHAFDAAKIRGGKVVVKKLAEGTVFKTLDDKDVKLSANDLMICDAEGGMCIAGVFGGADSGVTNATTSIFLESAYFAATGIRKTGTRLNLRTDAAMHFEKGTDPNITVEALKRAAVMICEICGGSVSSEIIDIYPQPVEGWKFTVSYDRILKLAGFAIEKETIKQILNHLEIKIGKEEGDEWQLVVPAFKTDVKREADIVEEVIRILGYNSFTLPKGLKSNLALSPKVDAQKLENVVAGMLTGAGFNEIWTNSITQSKYEEDEQLKAQQVKLLNSQTAELDSLRTSMLYSSLEVIAYNQNRKATDLRLYEFGRTYYKTESGYKEGHHLQIVLTGKTNRDNWLQRGSAYSFYHLKSVVMNVLERLGHTTFETEVIETSPFTFGLVLRNEGIEVARLGSIAKPVLAKFDIKNEVFFANLNWAYLLEKSQFGKVTFSELPKFPSVKRDLAMVVNEDLQFAAIEKIAVAESKKLLQEVSLFDVYKGDKMEKGKKSYAISFVFQHPDKTLTDQEIEKLMSKLMSKYENELGAVIRKS
ncbi:MAG TPA: phenylalanine--tRNA ligase subunit beta [Chitinophagales bacterium]|nr:phenylalanine--tRNA ligase subunit beta [Chitinophagales bacterium]